ncbi:hypothetical protein E2C01_082593 [Portunus trituberculatus]|uniref:Uncharacterized protein n=1 Tax=Portunus trituberculatus TaxID=210409 RepID=A0A5B7IQC6_PORTR|nr:hypothetical protein [Portunus trituberculatus]
MTTKEPTAAVHQDATTATTLPTDIGFDERAQITFIMFPHVSSSLSTLMGSNPPFISEYSQTSGVKVGGKEFCC